jgi:hypothetical protein
MSQLRHLKLITLILAFLVPSAAAQGQAILPATLAGQEGNANNTFPFNCGSGVSSARYQQVYLGSEVGTGRITELRFRLEGFNGCATGFSQTLSNVTIQLSSTTTAHPLDSSGGLSATFAENIGPDVTTVFSGDLLLSSSGSPAIPRPFDIVVPLKSRFFFDSSTGANLLLDVSLPACPPVAFCNDSNVVVLDSHFVANDGVARVFAHDHTSPIAEFSDTLGLVTQVIFPIFEDGFESGNTSAWSFSVP